MCILRDPLLRITLSQSRHSTPPYTFLAPCYPCRALYAILHALTDPHPKTRYYPATAAVKLGDAFPAWLAAIIIRATSVHPLIDRLQDLLVAKIF